MNEDTAEPIGRAQLARYVAGECDDAERARIEAWLETRPARRRLVASLSEAWRLTANDEDAWGVDPAWQAVQGRREARVPERAASRRSALASWAVRAAAVIVLLVGGGLVLARLERGDAPAVSVAGAFSTGVSEQREVTLADGTVVVLAPESRLRVLSSFGAGAREVELTGQAVFQVTHDASRPFRVRAGTLSTEVLGTRFVVRAYGGDGAATIALVEGSVRVRSIEAADSGYAVTLQPGQIARADDGTVRIDADVSIDAWLAWTEGRLVFDDTPMSQVARELARWYDVDVQLVDSTLAQRRLTGSFAREPIERVIDLIALSLDLRYERAGREFLLSTR